MNPPSSAKNLNVLKVQLAETATKVISASKWNCLAKRYQPENCTKYSLPSKGGSSPVFWEGHPLLSDGWMAALITLAGDIETNPGPPNLSASKYICPICTKPIYKNHISFLCYTSNPHWIHRKCSGIQIKQHHPTWTCPLHTTTSTPQLTQIPFSDTAQNITSTNTVAPQLTSVATTDQRCASTQRDNTIHPIYTNTNTQSTTRQSHTGNNYTKPPLLKILQININGISNKLQELELLIDTLKPDIICIQETKLNKARKSPQLPHYTTNRTDRQNSKTGGGLITFIHNSITYTELPPNPHNKGLIESQTFKIHLNTNKYLHVSNIYIPPRDTTNPLHTQEDEIITASFTYLTSLSNSIITGDINAHSNLWHSPITDHRGTHIQDILNNSDHIVLNTNTPTRVPNNAQQQPTSPDITSISSSHYLHTTWQTTTALSSDHLPIVTTIDTKTKFHNTQNRLSYTNYKKADWSRFTSKVEEIISNNPAPTDPHKSNTVITNAILHADKCYIPKGKINHHHIPLPLNIRDKINHRDAIRRNNPHDQSIPELNLVINKLIQTHRSQLWQDKINQNFDHQTNTHILWQTINNLSGKKQSQCTNRTISFNGRTKINHKDIATAFNHQFTHPTTYTTNRSNRIIDRQTRKLPLDPQFSLSTEQVAKAIANSNTNTSVGPDNINIQHLKHLGPIALQYLTDTYNLAIQTNTIPHSWKLAKIIPIPKPNKDPNLGTSHRPISLLSPIAKVLEKAILPYISTHIPQNKHQHGFKPMHSTSTALHNITNTIIKGFNEKQPPARTVLVSLDLSKAFDTVNTRKLIHKIHQTTIPPAIQKFIANYLKGRKAFTAYANAMSSQSNLKTGVPQGSVLSPCLFNLYMSDLPPPPANICTDSYADDINTLSSHCKVDVAQANLQPYLDSIFNWTKENDLILNPDKSTSTLFTPDPAEYSMELHLSINDILIPTVKNPKVLGLTLDPKLNFSEHIKITNSKAQATIPILKALTSTTWGKSNETITNTYKAVTRSKMEHANTVWSTTASDTSLAKLQTTQNQALRIASGCTLDTNVMHLHHETKVLPIKTHLQLQGSLYKLKTLQPQHPLHNLNNQPAPPRKMKTSIFHHHSNTYTPQLPPTHLITNSIISAASKTIHTSIVQEHLLNCPNNKLLNAPYPEVSHSEQSLPRRIRRILAQLRTNKSPILMAYKHHIDPTNYPSPACPLCSHTPHDTNHLFNCPVIPTTLTVQDLWTNPCLVAELLDIWSARVALTH